MMNFYLEICGVSANIVSGKLKGRLLNKQPNGITNFTYHISDFNLYSFVRTKFQLPNNQNEWKFCK
jgi:hypothetical protein